MRQDIAKNREVAEAFYRHTREVVADSGFPVLEVNGTQQRGSDFGTRLANAVADAFAQGYERVIAVGSDCPRLHEVDWAAVADLLDEGTPVLGPTSDRDGTYLIGLRRSQFDKDAFAALPWQSSALFPALTQHLAAQAGGAPALLAPRDDVNGPGDLAALLRSPGASPRGLVEQLRSVLGPTSPVADCRTVTASPSLPGRRSRAPPSLPSSSRPLVGS